MKAKQNTTQLEDQPMPEPTLEVISLLEPVNQLDVIAALAYYKAQARGFTPGRELDDWLEAEAELTAAG